MSETLILVIIFAVIMFFMHRGHGTHGGGGMGGCGGHSAHIKDTGRKKVNLHKTKIKEKMNISIITEDGKWKMVDGKWK